jgi:phosphodiesterase/alkaline phosphatase D-like protein
MWDDHDIFNDWGSRLRESPLDRRLFEAASRAYCEYQHPRNPGGEPGPPPYPYRFRYGTAGFLVLDVRGARDYRSGLLLGTPQWEGVRAYLRGAEARDLQTLFVVAGVPLAHFSRWVVALFESLHGPAANEVRDRWCSRAVVDHRDALLGELFAWQAARPRRQVVLLSGDVHAASAFTIRRRDGPGVVRQFTSSALTNQSSAAERLLNRIGARGPNLGEPHLRFRRHLLVTANNFGLVRVEPLDGGGHRLEFGVRAWRPTPGELRDAGRVVVEPTTGRRGMDFGA